jgi:rhodanese-related sulfurtransferase
MLKHRTAFIAAALLGIAVLLPGLAVAQNYPPSVKELVATTKKQIKTMDMAAFKAALDKKSAGLIVDVRSRANHRWVRPGAINVPRGLIEFTIWEHVGVPDKTDMNKQISLYCKTGGRCALAAKSLKDLGLTNVTAVDMVFENWVKAGYPVMKK